MKPEICITKTTHNSENNNVFYETGHTCYHFVRRPILRFKRCPHLNMFPVLCLMDEVHLTQHIKGKGNAGKSAPKSKLPDGVKEPK